MYIDAYLVCPPWTSVVRQHIIEWVFFQKETRRIVKVRTYLRAPRESYRKEVSFNERTKKERKRETNS